MKLLGGTERARSNKHNTVANSEDPQVPKLEVSTIPPYFRFDLTECFVSWLTSLLSPPFVCFVSLGNPLYLSFSFFVGKIGQVLNVIVLTIK